MLGQLAAVGHVDLVERPQAAAGRPAPPYVGASSASIASRSLIGSRPGSSVAQSSTCDQHRAALDVAQELQAQALALADAPGISPGTSATV